LYELAHKIKIWAFYNKVQSFLSGIDTSNKKLCTLFICTIFKSNKEIYFKSEKSEIEAILKASKYILKN